MVNSAGAEAHAKRLRELLQQRAEEAMPLVAEALTMDAISRAPTVDEEYNELMAGSGGEAIVPRAGDRSGDTDGRIRLSKPESTYLANALANPANVVVEGARCVFGNTLFLEECTRYSYFNKRRTGKDTWELSDEHFVGPYLWGIEEGATATIVPVFTLSNNHRYRLRPSDDETDPGLDSMEKSFSPHFMFNRASLEAAARATLKTAFAELGT